MDKELTSINPTDNEEIGRVQISSEDEIKGAVKKAHAALPAWKALSPLERGEYFKKFLEIYKKRVRDIAELQTREMGKPITESLAECSGRAVALELNIERSIRVLEPQILDKNDTYQ